MDKFAMPKCGLLLLGSHWFKNTTSGEKTSGGTYTNRLEQKATEIIHTLSKLFDVTFQGIVYSKEDVMHALKLFMSEEVDFVIASFMSWTEDSAWIRFLRDMPDIPLIFYLPVDEEVKFKNCDPVDDLLHFLTSGQVVGALEGSGSIRRMGKKVRVIAGNTKDKETLERINAFGWASKARNVLRNAQFGVLANFNELMWSTYIDPYRFFVEVGPEIKFISYSQLKEEIDRVTDEEVNFYLNQLKNDYHVLDGVDERRFSASVRASIGIARLSEELKLDAVVLKDIDVELHKKIGLRPGFYHPDFNKHLSVLVPEADTGTAAIMFAIKVMTKKCVNFIEPFYIEKTENVFAAGHAGPNDHTDSRFKGNVLIAPDVRYEGRPFEFAGAPFAWYRFPPGKKTMVHFSECKDRYKIFTTIVESIEGPHIIAGYSHSLFKTKVPPEELFEKIIDIGTNQHFVIVEGDVRKELEALAFISNYDYYTDERYLMKKVLIFADEGYHELELFYPWYRFIEEGIECDIASSQIKPITGKRGKLITPSITYDKVNPDDYQVLIIPGGHAPEIIRQDEKALQIVRVFFYSNKTVGCICHGGQVLVSAGILKGKKGTCYRSIKDDLIAAGMEYIDEPVVVDGNLITSRQPSDLPYFAKELIKVVKKFVIDYEKKGKVK